LPVDRRQTIGDKRCMQIDVRCHRFSNKTRSCRNLWLMYWCILCSRPKNAAQCCRTQSCAKNYIDTSRVFPPTWNVSPSSWVERPTTSICWQTSREPLPWPNGSRNSNGHLRFGRRKKARYGICFSGRRAMARFRSANPQKTASVNIFVHKKTIIDGCLSRMSCGNF